MKFLKKLRMLAYVIRSQDSEVDYKGKCQRPSFCKHIRWGFFETRSRVAYTVVDMIRMKVRVIAQRRSLPMEMQEFYSLQCKQKINCMHFRPILLLTS